MKYPIKKYRLKFWCKNGMVFIEDDALTQRRLINALRALTDNNVAKTKGVPLVPVEIHITHA